MTSTIGWELYRSLLGVLREGSLSAAARELGITQPTVGRHVAALEHLLGATLFTRSHTGLLPTDAALALRSFAEGMDSMAAALERAASSQGDGVQGVVRVSASEVVGAEVLPPVLAELRERHPALTIELVLSNRVQDLLRREADIAVRMVRPRQSKLVARRIGDIEVGMHAHPSYLARCGTPHSVAELAAHTVIGYDQPTAFLRAAARRSPALDRATFHLRADSDLAQLALIRAGAGIGFCQVPIARRDGLERVVARAFSINLDTWVTMHEDLRASPRCQVVFDALVRGLLSHAGVAQRRASRTK
jgi:DNA-binding transcriptional LysR family regulator